MESFLAPLFIGVLSLAHIILLIAVIYALMGYFGTVEADKPKHYATASKLLLVYALMFVVGLGSCVAVIAASH